jgi:hypothetical protein
MWLDLLPDLEDATARAVLSQVAAAMAGDGGVAHC